jgi:hypothetical protein
MTFRREDFLMLFITITIIILLLGFLLHQLVAERGNCMKICAPYMVDGGHGDTCYCNLKIEVRQVPQ